MSCVNGLNIKEVNPEESQIIFQESSNQASKFKFLTETFIKKVTN